jgi:hypothetical protein
MVERATQIEMSGRVMAWTTDHWTGPNGLTYGAVTAHYINEKWELVSVLIDFKVFEGRTTGALIFDDISSVLSKFKPESVLLHTIDGDDSIHEEEDNKPIDSIGITDTTGNMGKLGEYLRDNKQEHGYCFVAGIAFDCKSQENLNLYCFCGKLHVSSLVVSSQKCAGSQRSYEKIEVSDWVLRQVYPSQQQIDQVSN